MFCCTCSLWPCLPIAHIHPLSRSDFLMLSVGTEWLVTMSPLLCERSACSSGWRSQLSVLPESLYSQNIWSSPASLSAFSNHKELLMTERRGETLAALVTGETWGLHWVSVHRMNRCLAWQKPVALLSVVYKIAYVTFIPKMSLKMQNYYINFNSLDYLTLLCHNV